MKTQPAPLPPFKAQILLEMVLTDLALDLAIVRLLFVRTFLDQAYSQIRVDVCTRHPSRSLISIERMKPTGEGQIYRPLVQPQLFRRLETVSPVQAFDLTAGRKIQLRIPYPPCG
ncbi:hypothetical protein N7G274_009717 [Stereocaulon virgatum]|uniref:Uncharacterized protein n=1 Tax=Stereocaulon virgatum TaxID=373712 RepID=A0ABR3ZVG8_9LECA